MNPSGYTSLADARRGQPQQHQRNLAVGQTVTGRDFEIQSPPGAIGDTVWLDVDGDGVQDVGEPGLANVTVDAQEGDDGTFVASTDDRYERQLPVHRRARRGELQSRGG